VRREAMPDSQYGSKVVGKFINKLMIGGKKGTAERVMYDALAAVERNARRNPLEVFEQAMRNTTPVIEVKAKRIGGSTYQVPIEIRGDRRQSLAIRWIIASARNRSGHSMAEKLAAELLDASNNQGATVKKREDTHKMAEANKAFAHYRF
jgi:small subunit ribosomal protein S7